MKIILIISCVLIFISICIFIIWYFTLPPQCGGNYTIKADCSKTCPENANKNENFFTNLITFYNQLADLQSKQKDGEIMQILSLEKNVKVYSGTFFFMTPELLQILPSDFGQNPISPYGVCNFSQNFIPCIQNVDKFCETLIDENTNANPTNIFVKEICSEMLSEVKENNECIFAVNDGNDNLQIDNNNIFNQLGTIGTFSLSNNQAIILKLSIPAKDLDLIYWSIIPYLADDLSKENICNPMYQIYFASLLQPLNNFRAMSITNGKKKSFDNISCILILSLNPSLSSFLGQKLEKLNVDFIYEMIIPTAQNSFPLQENLPNPNNITKKDTYFNNDTCRISLLLRVTPNPNQSNKNQMIQDYLYQNGRNDFELLFVEKENNLESQSVGFSSTVFPPILPPPFDEVKMFAKSFKTTRNKIMTDIGKYLFFTYKIPSRYNIVSITAPLFPSIRGGKIPYKGGYQAQQLGGNMLADNHDAQYRTSKAACLAEENEVLMAIGVNHSHIGNCFYNSISIVDVNRAYSYDSKAFSIMEIQKSNYYIYLAGRDASFLQNVKEKIQKIVPDIPIFTQYIRTGSSENFDIPACHYLSFVERIYLNMNISIDGKTLNLQDVVSEENPTPEMLKALDKISAPSLETMVEPQFYKITQNLPKFFIFIICFLIIVFIFSISLFFAR